MTSAGPPPDPLERHREMFANRLRKNLKRIVPAMRRLGVSCYRLYDADIPEIPLAVDWYEGRLHVGYFARRKTFESPEEDGRWLEAMLDVLCERLDVAEGDIFVKTRQRQKGTAQYGRFGRDGAWFEVEEDGLTFRVNLSDYLDTGLFLDHRITRQMVRNEAAGKDVLNLFAYTGAFSVHAAAGRARTTTTVDMSNTYLRWARENLALNGFSGPAHRTERADVLAWLERPGNARPRYDLVVVDPPTFSNSKRMDREFDIQRDHPRLLERTLAMTRPGGVVYFSTNFRQFTFEAPDLPASQLDEITHRTIPLDFKISAPHRCWRIVR